MLVCLTVSGYYKLKKSSEILFNKFLAVYMEELCGTQAGWTRVAYLNMSDPPENYPNGFNLYRPNGLKACGQSHALAI